LLLSLKDENKVKKIKFSTICKNRIKNKTLPKKHDVADVQYGEVQRTWSCLRPQPKGNHEYTN